MCRVGGLAVLVSLAGSQVLGFRACFVQGLGFNTYIQCLGIRLGFCEAPLWLWCV